MHGTSRAFYKFTSVQIEKLSLPPGNLNAKAFIYTSSAL